MTPVAGYWRIGFDAATLWPNSNLGMAFTGTMRFAAVYPSALSAAAVRAHYRAGSAP